MSATRKTGSARPLTSLASANSTAERAVDVLLLFTDRAPRWHAAEIAERFGMPRSTTHRYLASLKSRALLADDGRGWYRLGPRVHTLARTARRSTAISQVATSALAAVHAQLGETVILFERAGGEIFALERIESGLPVIVVPSPSRLLPWPANPSAKLLLAYADERAREQLMKQMTPVRYTRRTIATFAGLRREIDRIVRVGYAIGIDERDDGVSGVAAPVRGPNGVRYGVGLAAPSFRLNGARLQAAIEAVCEAAERLGRSE